VIVATGGCGLIFGRSTMSMACTGSAVGALLPRRREVRQRRVHPSPSDRHSRRRQTATDERERSRRRWPRVGAAQTARPARPKLHSREAERYYFLEERYPKYKNLVPRDIATREIFSICT
jgi:succinate dehydrogenase / fumarate reductase flavoprotein subunit